MADLIEQNKTAFANLEVLDNGKPFAEADFDIQCSIDVLRYYAGWCDKIHGNTIPAGKHENTSKISVVFFFKLKMQKFILSRRQLLCPNQKGAHRCRRTNHPMELSTVDGKV